MVLLFMGSTKIPLRVEFQVAVNSPVIRGSKLKCSTRAPRKKREPVFGGDAVALLRGGSVKFAQKFFEHAGDSHHQQFGFALGLDIPGMRNAARQKNKGARAGVENFLAA